MTFNDYVLIELIKAGFALVLLVITWFGGQKILANWELKKKQKELDIAAANQFQQLYGEYKSVWRLWKIFCGEITRDNKFTASENARWELLGRITLAEGNLEAIVGKLVTERVLTGIDDVVDRNTINVEDSESDVVNIGLFRQAYQQLRQGIRDGDALAYNHKDPRYILFNELACSVAILIGSDKKGNPPNSEESRKALTAISKIRQEQLLQAVQIKEKSLPPKVIRRKIQRTQGAKPKTQLDRKDSRKSAPKGGN